MRKIKLLLAVLASVAVGTTVMAQSGEVEELDRTLYQVIDQMPEFVGGMDGLMRYMTDNVAYPQDAKAAGVEGIVYVKFVVERDGSVSGASVMNEVDESLAREALRVVQNMPRWRAGKHKGKAVRVQYTLPVNFMLPHDEQKKGE